MTTKALNRLRINEVLSCPVGASAHSDQGIYCTTIRSFCYLSRSVAQSDAHPTGDHEVAGSIPAGLGNILSLRLIMKYFLRQFSLFASSRRILSVSGEPICTITAKPLRGLHVCQILSRISFLLVVCRLCTSINIGGI